MIRGPTADGVYARFRGVARERPTADALIVDGQAVSYLELHQQVADCAGALRALGCGLGDAIAVGTGNSLDFVVGTLATFALGGVLVPLNPRFKPDELDVYVAASRPRAMIYAQALEAWVASAASAIPVLARSCAELGAGKTFEPPEGFSPDSPAIHMFSSGSTGKSKRITRSQAQLMAEYHALARTVGLGSEERILCTVPLYHAHGFVNAMLAALMSGGTLVLPTQEFNARSTLRSLAEHGVTMYPSVPFMLKILADTRLAETLDLRALRLVISAGAPLPEAVAQQFWGRFGIPISQLYGSTETGAMTINLQHAADKPTSVGRPMVGYEAEVRDEGGDSLGAGETGEIWFRSSAMTSRYDDLPEVTAQCFAAGWFFAGDTGYADGDGDLYITGRKKLMINVAGLKVDPLEVEAVISQHPAVAEVVVLGVAHNGYGEKIKAVIVPRMKGACSEAEVIEYAAARLAEYKLPKLVEFRDEVPRSPLGKILRKYL